MDIPVAWDLVNNDVDLFSFKGDVKQAKVVDVYDGDTIKLYSPFRENYTNLIVESNM